MTLYNVTRTSFFFLTEDIPENLNSSSVNHAAYEFMNPRVDLFQFCCVMLEPLADNEAFDHAEAINENVSCFMNIFFGD